MTSYYLRTPLEMSQLFAEVPEALSNTLLIAERCNVDLSFKGYHLPDFPVPEGYTAGILSASSVRGRGEKALCKDDATSPEVQRKTRLRVERRPQDGIRRLLPDRLGPVPLCPRKWDLVQRPRFGGRLDRRLRIGHYAG